MKSLLPSLWSDADKGDAFVALQKEIDRVFSDFGRGFRLPAMASETRLAPRIDVSETDQALEITAELPGVDEKDIEITLVDDLLTIKGEKKAEAERKEKDYHIVERSYGAFQRSLRLPFDADSGKVEAHFEKGVLKVTVPKPPEVEAKSQKIAIKSKA
jgi:HSP20 family protein